MTRRDRPTPLRRSGVVFALVLALAGCGGGAGNDGGDDPEKRSQASILIEDASRATLARGTTRQYLDFHTEPERKVAFTAEGVADMRADDERGTFRYEKFEDLEQGTEIEFIFHDEVDYFRAGGTESWIKTKTTEEDAVANSNDVTSGLQRAGAVSNDARPVGRESIRGVPTIKYEATSDLNRMVETLPPDQRDEAEKMLRVFKTRELPFEIWIDDDGLIRRMRNVIESDDLILGLGGEDRMVAVLDLYDFGADARVEPPPPEQTVDE
jgi:hypothetical protein